MNSRKENETLYQNNAVELNDEALTNVVGGCGQSHDCNGGGWNNGDGNSWGNGNGWNNGDGNGCGNGNGNGYGRGGRGRGRDGILEGLGDVLGAL